MDKRLILSVAGSGKTTFIINSLSLEKRVLILTYTENNFNSIKDRIIEKFGYLPTNIVIYTYFKFLYDFCYKPYLSKDIKAKGYDWNTPPAWTMKRKRTERVYYLDKYNRLYHNRLAKLIEIFDKVDNIGNRVNKYFDIFYIDEVQDFGGHDFNLLMGISKRITNVVLVGDYYQHTFDTSRDGAVNRSLHKDYEKFIKRFKTEGFTIDKTTLSNSYRCSKNICDFVKENLGIEIDSHKDQGSKLAVIAIPEEIKKIVEDDKIIKLFYQNSNKYNCYSQNWGESKGQNHFENVCVVLNKTTYKHFNENTLNELNEQTRNKLYVACTRANKDLIFVNESDLKSIKIKMNRM